MTSDRRFWFLIAFLGVLEIPLFFLVDRTAAFWAHNLCEQHVNVKEIFSALTQIGLGKWYAWSSGPAFLVSALLFLKAPLSEIWRERFKNWAFQTGFFFFATSGAGLATDAIKFLVGRARPKMLLEHGVFGFDPFVYTYLWNSFPSGHTTTIVSVAAALSFLFPKGRWAFFLFAALIAASRVVVGAHYPSDVMGGALVGLVFTRFSIMLLHRTKQGM